VCTLTTTSMLACAAQGCVGVGAQLLLVSSTSVKEESSQRELVGSCVVVACVWVFDGCVWGVVVVSQSHIVNSGCWIIFPLNKRKGQGLV